MRIPAVLGIIAFIFADPFLLGSFSELPNPSPVAVRLEAPAHNIPSVPAADSPADDLLGSRKALESAALELLHFPWQELGYRVVFMRSRPGYRGMTITTTRRIEIYVRPGDTPRRLAHTLAHEFGHVIDLKYNTAQRRSRWMEARGINPETPWFGCNACSDYATPAGDFAESFAAMMVGPEFYSGRIMPPPVDVEVPNLAPFFSSIRLSGQGFQFVSVSGR